MGKERTGWIQKTWEPFRYQDDRTLSGLRCSYSLRLTNLMCSLWFHVAREMFMVSDPHVSASTPLGCLEVPLSNQGHFSLFSALPPPLLLSHVSCLHSIYPSSCLHKHPTKFSPKVLFHSTYKSFSIYTAHTYEQIVHLFCSHRVSRC